MEQSKGKTILLADDEQFIVVAYKTGLEHAGYQVAVAHDGEAALAYVKDNPVDLVLLDIIMPKLNGFEVLKAIRAEESIAGLPVIVFTNLSQASDEAEARRYGVVDFVVKANSSLNELVARIDRYFSEL